MLHSYIEKTNKEVLTNRKYDKAILVVGVVSLALNAFIHFT